MKHLYLFFIALFLFNVGCKKPDSPDVPETSTSDFKFSSGNTAYLTQVIEIIPTEEIGKSLDWTCDFGDGVKINGKSIASIPHSYVKEGSYKVSYTVAGKATIQSIRIFPGLRSYQIKSSLSDDLFVSSQVADNRKDGHTFGIIKSNSLTDSVFSISTDNQAVKMIVYGGFTGKNNILYNFSSSSLVPPLELYKHTVVELKDNEIVTVTYTVNGKFTELQLSLGAMLKL